MTKLSTFLLATLAACSTQTSTVGQAITCETDPESGEVVRCEPGEGTGGDDTCEDIDEDGDGQPGDDDVVLRTGDGSDDDDDDDDDTDDDGDSDDDGIDDDRDCDEQPGEDDDESDLPYNFDMSLGETYAPILDAFASEGGAPAEILSIEMAGGNWRLAELLAGTAFVVTDADCAHEGNKDVGKDRIELRWKNADGSIDSDHMTLRYCHD